MINLLKITIFCSVALLIVLGVHRYVAPIPGIHLHTTVGTGISLSARRARIDFEAIVREARRSKDRKSLESHIHLEERKVIDKEKINILTSLLVKISNDAFEVIDAHANEFEASLKLRVKRSDLSILTRFVHLQKNQTDKVWQYVEHHDFLKKHTHDMTARTYLAHVRNIDPPLATRKEKLHEFRLGSHKVSQSQLIHFDLQNLYLWAYSDSDLQKPRDQKIKIRLFDKTRTVVDSARTSCKSKGESLSFAKAPDNLKDIKYFSVSKTSC